MIDYEQFARDTLDAYIELFPILKNRTIISITRESFDRGFEKGRSVEVTLPVLVIDVFLVSKRFRLKTVIDGLEEWQVKIQIAVAFRKLVLGLRGLE
jgi:hypothetical protein